MRKTAVATALSAVLVVLAAGCGSSSHSTATRTSGAKAASATPATSTASSSPYGGYGGGSSSSSGSPAALITTKHSGKLGTVLAYGPKHLTVYLFEKDKGNASSCTGPCAKFWPPVMGTPTARGGAASSALATVSRPGGGKQVTYKGHPLYLFTKDGDAGDAYGEDQTAFGGKWYAVKPSGTADDLS